MSNIDRDRALSVALIVTGLVFIGGIGALMRLWPAGFAWTPGQGEYELMFVGVYAHARHLPPAREQGSRGPP